jgi:hypothetical protein
VLCRQGLLYERLTLSAEAKLEKIGKKKEMDYKAGLGKVRKLGAHDILGRDELHPSLKQVQLQQAQANRHREVSKPPPAFCSRGLPESVRPSSSFSSSLGVRLSPGHAPVHGVRLLLVSGCPWNVLYCLVVVPTMPALSGCLDDATTAIRYPWARLDPSDDCTFGSLPTYNKVVPF